MTRSKVTRCLTLEILRFSKSISSAIFNVSWQMTTDSETTEQYLTFVRSRFLISVLVVSLDFELGTGWHWFSLQMLLQLQLNSLGGGAVRRRPQSRTGLIYLILNCCSAEVMVMEGSRCRGGGADSNYLKTQLSCFWFLRMWQCLCSVSLTYLVWRCAGFVL